MKLFFNYRRDDTDDLAGRLHDRLSVEFGAENIFKDVDSIRPGQNWRVALEQSVASCDIVLAIIGQQWLSITDESGQRRIDADEDFVRFELEAARRAGKIVMPVVVKGAAVPNPKLLPESIRWLSDFQQSELRADPFFKDDVARLLTELVRIRDRLNERPSKTTDSSRPARTSSADAGGIIRCGSCHAECDRADQFCQVCGAELWTACPSCELPVPQNQVFCGGCGTNLPKLRELIALTEKIRARFSDIVSISDAGERMTSMEILSREIDAAIRIYPEHEPLERLQNQAAEVYRHSARELADSVYESGKRQVAREHYIALKQIDPQSEHASARLSEIDSGYDSDVANIRHCLSKGNFKSAVDRLLALCDAFPADTKLQAELQRCQAVVARLSRLVPEGLRELKRHRQLMALEQELLWLRQEKIPLKNLVAWLKEVKGSNRQANHDFLLAQSELRDGRFRKARKLANAILKTVADHAGAAELLAATSDTEEKIARLDALLQRQQFCAANQIVTTLEQKNIADPRLTRLAAATKVEIASLDSSIRLILVLFCLSCVPGYFVGDKFYDLMKLEQLADEGIFRDLVWLCTVVAMPLFLVSVIFAVTSHRAERVSRFMFDWLPFGRIMRKSESGDALSQITTDEVDEEVSQPSPQPATDPTAEQVAAVSPTFVVPPRPAAAPDDDVDGKESPIAESPVIPDPILFQTVDLDRAAGLVELLSAGVLTFCLSVAGGEAFWNWLLGLRFDAAVPSDARTLEILSPVSSVFPLLAMTLLSVALESAARWPRIIVVGGVSILVEFLAAILFPAAVPTIHVLLLTCILVLTISEIRRIEFWRALVIQIGGLAGASLVLSAVAVPLIFLAVMLEFASHSIPANSFGELMLVAFFICQLFVSIASAGSIQISRLAADYPAVRGTLAVGIGWIAAVTISLTAGWLTFMLKEEWYGPGRWVLLLLLAQALPFALSGRRGLSVLRPWLVLSAILVTTMSLMWWIVPSAAVLVFPATFAFSVIGLLRLETTNLFEQGAALWAQLKIRQSRRMFLVKQRLRRK